MACAWKNPKCRIGMIIGTGTNACYLEDIDNVGTWDGDHNEPKHVIINTEWGAFGNQGELDFILTKWDREVDRESINPGKQLFEKMISGMYMGEVVRQVLVDLIEEGLIFTKDNIDKLLEKGGFLTKYVSEIESDQVGDYTRCGQVLKEIGIDNPSEEDCSALRYNLSLLITTCITACYAGMCVSVCLAEQGSWSLLGSLLSSRRWTTRTWWWLWMALCSGRYYLVTSILCFLHNNVLRFHPHFPNIVRSRIAQLMGTDYQVYCKHL